MAKTTFSILLGRGSAHRSQQPMGWVCVFGEERADGSETLPSWGRVRLRACMRMPTYCTINIIPRFGASELPYDTAPWVKTSWPLHRFPGSAAGRPITWRLLLIRDAATTPMFCFSLDRAWTGPSRCVGTSMRTFA